jgi:transcriptional regulator with XRE-family HTH domain
MNVDVKQFMKIHGSTQNKLADEIAVAAGTVAGWLNDKTDPGISNVEAIGRYLATFATKPQDVEIDVIWAVRCVLKSNGLNNWNTKNPSEKKYHDNVLAFYDLDGKGGVKVRIERQL